MRRFTGIDGDWKEARNRGRPGESPFADMCMCVHVCVYERERDSKMIPNQTERLEPDWRKTESLEL